jgi:hypothetical protein
MDKKLATINDGNFNILRVEYWLRDCPFCGNSPVINGTTITCGYCNTQMGENWRLKGIDSSPLFYFTVNKWNGKVKYNKNGMAPSKYYHRIFEENE